MFQQTCSADNGRVPVGPFPARPHEVHSSSSPCHDPTIRDSLYRIDASSTTPRSSVYCVNLHFAGGGCQVGGGWWRGNWAAKASPSTKMCILILRRKIHVIFSTKSHNLRKCRNNRAIFRLNLKTQENVRFFCNIIDFFSKFENP